MPKELITERLVLRPISEKHITEKYLSWLNDTEVYKYLESGGNYTFTMLKEYVQEHLKKETLFWGIHLKENNIHIGNIKIDPLDMEKRTGEYGIIIGDRSAWGKGFAREASQRVIKFCFQELNLKSITLGVIEVNESALYLYQNLGFQTYKRIPNKGIYNKKHCDAIRMILLNE
ncbi:GNAT family N-acetyltransferase [Robiginitalea sp. IMCC44478]|uniref:GNAT family N-acetyltransferase n=1 Tax=Robiginitalea sp. IMCC44478 TaxID=3459122 RepID=UPI00404135DA